MTRDWQGRALVAGFNVDPINYDAGMVMLAQTGWVEPEIKMVVHHALQRWARGEEEQAERGAIDRSFHGIDFTSWRMVLAAAVSA